MAGMQLPEYRKGKEVISASDQTQDETQTKTSEPPKDKDA